MQPLNILELKPNVLTYDLTSYNFLLYAFPGMGKTTFAKELFPEKHIILGSEFGYKGIPGAVGVPIPDYFSLLQYAEQLDTDAAREKYDTIIVDTSTKMGELVENYILSIYGKDALGDCRKHGAAYPLINRYYNLVFNKLKARGYNFVYICHALEIPIKNEKDEVIATRYKPKMSDRIASLIEPEVDYTFFLTQNEAGERIIVTDNNPRSVGKHRTDLPLILPMDVNVFMDEYRKGIDKKSNGKAVEKKVSNNVVGFKSEERDYKVIVEEIKALGQKLATEGKLVNAEAVVNNRLGRNDEGGQRTLDEVTQANVEMLETIILDLKKL